MSDALFSKTKSPLSLLRKSELIYQIPCSDRPAVYMGETRQYFSKRLNQHKNDVLKQIKDTALASHTKNENHSFLFDNASILALESHTKKKKFVKPSIKIIKDKSLNLRS